MSTQTPPATKTADSFGRRLWKAWLHVGHVMGTFNARVILTIFYVLVIAPYALIMRALIDPMRMREKHGWLERKTRDLTLSDATKQF